MAAGFFFFFFSMLHHKKIVAACCGVCLVGLSGLALLSGPVVVTGEQGRYKDKIILNKQTPYQKIIMTRWRDDYWLYINGQEQFSTVDEQRYHEPLVHPAMTLSHSRSTVLILGGGDGLALREVFKHPDVGQVVLVDLDPVMTRLAATHPVLARINAGSMQDRRLKVVNQDAKAFLETTDMMFDVIIADLPDPDTMELTHLYTRRFFRLANRRLAAGGTFVTQATSPWFSPGAFLCIVKTVESAGFSVLAYHNQVPTMGQWGWVLGVKSGEMTAEELKNRVLSLDLDRPDTRFLNSDAMVSMAHFGKDLDPGEKNIRVNTEFHPVIHTYYDSRAWEMY